MVDLEPWKVALIKCCCHRDGKKSLTPTASRSIRSRNVIRHTSKVAGWRRFSTEYLTNQQHEWEQCVVWDDLFCVLFIKRWTSCSSKSLATFTLLSRPRPRPCSTALHPEVSFDGWGVRSWKNYSIARQEFIDRSCVVCQQCCLVSGAFLFASFWLEKGSF